MSDPAKYRSEEEVAFWKERDVLVKIKAQIQHDFAVPNDEFEAIDAAVRGEVERAVQVAEAGRELTLDEARPYVSQGGC